MSKSSGSGCPLGPLRFRPLVKRAIWGGRRLETVLGKPLGDGDDYAESWEVSGHASDPSVVAEGRHAGQSLAQLMVDYKTDLLGKSAALDRFPLLVKWIDAHDRLSVQVHPNDRQAAALVPNEWGKTEAWIVLHAEPESRIYSGLKRGVGRPQLEKAIAENRVADCLHDFEPKPGDCLLIPAGTVHALGAGMLIYEVQQTSDVTFRLYDWDRTDAAGNPRALHVAESLEVIDFARGPVEPHRWNREHTDDRAGQTLIECEYFVLNGYRTSGSFTLGGDGRFHVVTVFDGNVELHTSAPMGPGTGCSDSSSSESWKLTRGETLLLPAGLPTVSIECESAILVDGYVP